MIKTAQCFFEPAAYWLLGRHFIAGRTRKAVLERAMKLKAQGFGVTINFLGEHHTALPEIETAVHEYLELIKDMNAVLGHGSVALKPTQIGLEFSEGVFRENLKRIIDCARDYGIGIEVDMEDFPHMESTMRVFAEFYSRLEYHGFMRLAIQANVRNLEEVLEKHGLQDASVRLVKGDAYKGPIETLIAGEEEVRESFIRLAEKFVRLGFTRTDRLYLASIADFKLVELIRQRLPDSHTFPWLWRFQMLYGLGGNLQKELRGQGYQVAIYMPYGTFWFPYALRRWKFLFKFFKRNFSRQLSAYGYRAKN